MMRLLLLTMALLAWSLTAAAQSPQSQARDLAPPVYYTPPAVYAAPQEAQLRYTPAPAEVHYPAPRAVVEVPIEAPRYVARQVRPAKGPLCLHLRMPGLRVVREPAVDASVRLAAATYYQPEPVESRGLMAPPKAPSPRGAPQTPAKDPGGIEAAEEPAWAARLAKRLDDVDRRLDQIQGTGGDRAPAPPAAPTK